jgi:hypothetical protein
VLEDPHLLEAIMWKVVVRDKAHEDPNDDVRASVMHLGVLALVSRHWKGVALGEGLWGPLTRRALPVVKHEGDFDLPLGYLGPESPLQAMLRRAGGHRAFMVAYGRGLRGGRVVRDDHWCDSLSLAITVRNVVTGQVALMEYLTRPRPLAEGLFILDHGQRALWIDGGGAGPGWGRTQGQEGAWRLEDEVARMLENDTLEARVTLHNKLTGRMAQVWEYRYWNHRVEPGEIQVDDAGRRFVDVRYVGAYLASTTHGAGLGVTFVLRLGQGAAEVGGDPHVPIMFEAALEVSATSEAELGALLTSLLE